MFPRMRSSPAIQLGLCIVKKRKLPRVLTLKSVEEFRRALMRERAVCDRKGQEFSLVAYEMAPHVAQSLRSLVHGLSERIRQTDETGWLDQSRVGVLLPDTPRGGAETVARDLSQLIGPA